MKHTTLPRHEYRAGLAADVAATIERDWSLSKRLRHLLNDEQPDGAEGAVDRHFSERRGWMDEHGPSLLVPWGALAKRDLTAGNLTAGGALIGKHAPPLVDFLRNYSVMARAGAMVLEAQGADMTVPGVVEPVELTWIAENADATQDQPLIGSTAVTPHIASATFNISGKLLRLAPPGLLDTILTRHLAAAAGRAIDTAALQGRVNGNMAEPVGLCALPVLQTYDYWPIAKAAGVAMAEAMEFVALRTGDDSRCRFVLSPATRTDLTSSYLTAAAVDGQQRELEVFGRTALISAGAPAGRAIYGDWTTAMLVLFGPGVEIAVDSYTHFKKDQVTVRVMVALDCAFPCAANAFATAKWAPVPE
jgi:HK97 family phage major capsid protein